MIPFVNLTAQRDAYRRELEAVEKRVLDSGCYIGGAEVRALEEELSCYCGAAHTITCGSGTQALELALMVLGLEPGDQVIVPDFTFIAPAECVQKLRGIPLFADIDKSTLQIDPESVKRLAGPRTKGIIAVNLFGQCAPYEKLREIANENGLWILEDSAQAFGAIQNGKKACTFGDISITSFYPSKPLGCYGDGGAIFTSNPEYAEKARLLANHGSSERYRHIEIGVNGRLDALQAAVLRVKLRHLDEELERRQQNAKVYDRFFEDAPGLTPQAIATGNTSTYAQYTLIAENRAEFISRLEKAGIPHCIHYPSPLHAQPCFNTASAGPATDSGCLITEKTCTQVLSLPFCAFTDTQEVVDRLK
ncbi:MAG: DegT/DnrJ/EryC1/StrS family aminotransferase [Fibrobacter sp.]|nr:DegT/DnrJ/EryC1/StrS family aminotransferase [Fibrobacter sp.]